MADSILVPRGRYVGEDEWRVANAKGVVDEDDDSTLLTSASAKSGYITSEMMSMADVQSERNRDAWDPDVFWGAISVVYHRDFRASHTADQWDAACHMIERQWRAKFTGMVVRRYLDLETHSTGATEAEKVQYLILTQLGHWWDPPLDVDAIEARSADALWVPLRLALPFLREEWCQPVGAGIFCLDVHQRGWVVIERLAQTYYDSLFSRDGSMRALRLVDKQWTGAAERAFIDHVRVAIVEYADYVISMRAASSSSSQKAGKLKDTISPYATPPCIRRILWPGPRHHPTFEERKFAVSFLGQVTDAPPSEIVDFCMSSWKEAHEAAYPAPDQLASYRESLGKDLSNLARKRYQCAGCVLAAKQGMCPLVDIEESGAARVAESYNLNPIESVAFRRGVGARAQAVRRARVRKNAVSTTADDDRSKGARFTCADLRAVVVGEADVRCMRNPKEFILGADTKVLYRASS